MLKHLNSLFLCNSNVVNAYRLNGKIAWYRGLKFLYHCQILPIFSFPFVRQNLMNDFKVLTRFSEISCISFTSNKVFYFFQVNMFLLAIFLKFIFIQKEKRSFVWSKTFDFLFQNPSNFYSEKKSCSLEVNVLEFQKYRKK